MRFLDILLGAALVAPVFAAPTQDAVASSQKQKRKSKFQFTGVNESGAEFGSGSLPGQLNKDYIWPAKSTIDVSEEHPTTTCRCCLILTFFPLLIRL